MTNGKTVYGVTEEKAWVKEGCSHRAEYVVEHAGYELKVTGYRITRDGAKVFIAYPPFATMADAKARIVSLQEVAK